MIENTRKLNVSDYVLEIDNRDIYNCTLKYSINEIEDLYYKDGSVSKRYNPVINLEIGGMDLDGNEAWISFEINIGLNELNKYSDEPVNIINILSKSEAFVKRPGYENSTFLNFQIPSNTIDDMYKDISSLWISKLDMNKFIFKICVPDEMIFSYFIVDFNKNNEC